MGYERNDRYGRRDYGRGQDRGDYGRPSGYDYEDRGFFDRAGDEVRSWFGDEEAERRRRYDERYDSQYRGERYPDTTAQRDGRYGRDDYGFESGRRGGWAERGGYGGASTYDAGRYSDEGARNYGSRGFGGYGNYYGSEGTRGGATDTGYRGERQGQRGGYGSQGQSQGHHDQNYQSWRDRQISALDQDYDEYRRENQSKFENEFSSYRTRRQGQRDLIRNVKEHTEVVGSDGQHVGTVDHVKGDRIQLTKNDQSAGGHHHTIPSSWIESADESRVTLSKTADQAKQAWREEQDNNQRGALGGRDRDQSGTDWNTGGNLNRSFSGTY